MSKPNKKHYLNLRIVVTALSMVVTVSMLIAAATAWLTVNRKAESNGVQMTVQGTSNLVIATDAADLDNDYTTFSITFPANSKKYIPVTHDDDAEAGSYLKTLEDMGEIVPETGFSEVGESFVTVPDDASGNYYSEYTVYIASAGGELADTDLSVILTYPEEDASGEPIELSETEMALSVDFFRKNGATLTYINTLNLACLDRADPECGLDELVIETGSVPAASSGAVALVMRVYYDGALSEDGETAFIRSANLTQRKFTFNIEFTAVEHVEEE